MVKQILRKKAFHRFRKFFYKRSPEGDLFRFAKHECYWVSTLLTPRYNG